MRYPILATGACGAPIVEVQDTRYAFYHMLTLYGPSCLPQNNGTGGYFTLSELCKLAHNLTCYVEQCQQTVTYEIDPDVWLPNAEYLKLGLTV